MSKNKEIEKRMLIKRTISAMEKQIQRLENQKRTYIEAGKQAKQKGLTNQYNLALSGLKMTISQQRRVYEMKLNFEITSQMKDMAKMTTEFLSGMSSLSKDMMKLTKESDFNKVQKQFSEAMIGMEVQTERMEDFLDETQSTFSTNLNSEEERSELDTMIGNELAVGEGVDSEIEKELEELKKKMS